MIQNSGLNAWITDMDGLEIPHGQPYISKRFAHGRNADVSLKVGKVSCLLTC